MKDAKNHLKQVQKKVIRAAKRENPPEILTQKKGETIRLNFKRPKDLLNKRKVA